MPEDEVRESLGAFSDVIDDPVDFNKVKDLVDVLGLYVIEGVQAASHRTLGANNQYKVFVALISGIVCVFNNASRASATQTLY